MLLLPILFPIAPEDVNVDDAVAVVDDDDDVVVVVVVAVAAIGDDNNVENVDEYPLEPIVLMREDPTPVPAIVVVDDVDDNADDMFDDIILNVDDADDDAGIFIEDVADDCCT